MTSKLRLKYLVFLLKKMVDLRLPTSADVIQAILFEQSFTEGADMSKICENYSCDIMKFSIKDT